ncbi:hypothetical protein BD770DRAFT_389561 [Pilaira anomala]|nr:hypothetical protein BD770DRAFT_389561 [Pilaira anomala]
MMKKREFLRVAYLIISFVRIWAPHHPPPPPFFPSLKRTGHTSSNMSGPNIQSNKVFLSLYISNDLNFSTSKTNIEY